LSLEQFKDKKIKNNEEEINKSGKKTLSGKKSIKGRKEKQ